MSFRMLLTLQPPFKKFISQNHYWVHAAECEELFCSVHVIQAVPEIDTI